MKSENFFKSCSGRNSPLRFGANALGQQEDMWLAIARPNPDYRRDFTYPQNVIGNGGK